MEGIYFESRIILIKIKHPSAIIAEIKRNESIRKSSLLPSNRSISLAITSDTISIGHYNHPFIVET